MATPVYNAAGNTSSSTALSTLTLSSFSAAAGSNRFLEVWTGIGTGGTPAAPTGVTWGGVALTQRGTALTATPFSMSKWYLKEASFPGGATGNIVATWAASHDERGMCAMVHADVDQTNPYRNASQVSENDTTSNTPSVTVTSNSADVVTCGLWACDQGGTLTGVSTTAGTERTDTGVIAGGYENLSASTVAGSSPTITHLTAGGAPDFTGMMADSLQGTSGSRDQVGGSIGLDDGSETAHTLGSASETKALGTAVIVRAQIDATGDPPSTAYQLWYSLNSGAYAAVATVASGKVRPVIEAGDCTISGNNTAQATWAVSHPAAAAGDLLIFYIAWDDSTTTTDVTEPSGVNGETLTEMNATPVTDSSTETRAKAWYCKTTGAWTATTITFTPSATESWSASVIKVLAGEFDATTPIGAIGTANDTTGTDTTVDSPAFSAGASDGTGALVWCAGVDTDTLSATPPTGWAIVQNQDLGAVAHGVAVRTAEVTNSESIASATWSIAGDSWTSIAFVVRAPTITNPVYVTASTNITNAEATTDRLSGGTGSFVAGKIFDTENGTGTVDITTDNFTELGWVITTQVPAANADTFDFRVYAAASPLTTYTVTPRWTIGSGASTELPPLTMPPMISMGWRR